jgi:hypothetical protein
VTFVIVIKTVSFVLLQYKQAESRQTHISMKKLLLFAFTASLLTAGCKKDGNEPTSEAILNSNEAELNKRVSTDDNRVIFIDPVEGQLKRTANDTSSNEYPLQLVATVSSPIYQGNTLRATHVEINGNYAYVSYNTEGNTYLGGIDVFNISNKTTPTLVTSITLPNTDVSALTYYDNKLYFAGSKDVSTLVGNTNPAFVGYFNLTNGVPSTTTYTSAQFSGLAATHIVANNGKIYFSTGSVGGMYVVNASTLAQEQFINIADVRSIAVNTDRIAVLTGSDLKIYNKTSYALIRTIASGTQTAEAKRTIEFKNNYILVAGGATGTKYYNTDNGQLADDISLPTSINGVLPLDIVTNAVSINNDLMFAANGGAGTFVITENQTAHTLTLVGAINLSSPNSANYVKSAGDYIFVATGKGGMKILKVLRPSTNCGNLATYTGNSNLNVNSNQNLSYMGALSLHNLNVGGTLYYCGSLAVANNMNINSAGTLEVNGTLAYGGGNNATLIINGNATLKIRGNLNITGNLILNSGAKLEFLGSNNTVTISGNVTKNSNVSITGNFSDLSGKL